MMAELRLEMFLHIGYGVCVISSSYSFQWIFLKPCILIVDILKMCILIFDGTRINLTKITAFKLRLFSHFCTVR